MTGWGNEHEIDAARRTLRGGGSGRLAFLIIANALLAVAVYGDVLSGVTPVTMFLTAASGIAVVLALWAVLRAARDRRVLRPSRRDHLAG